MKAKEYFLVTGVIFSVIGVLHVLRLILGWEAVIAGYSVPVWLSLVAVAVAGFLAYTSFKLRK